VLTSDCACHSASAMTEQTPTIRTADKDGEGPAKRRRRPALSCVECRGRKVRCDRKKPCGACTRVRSTTCSYRPHRAGVRARSPADAPASISDNDDQFYRHSARSSPQSYMSSDAFDTIASRNVTPVVHSEHERPGLQPLPPDRSNLNSDSQRHSGNSALISSLLERIRSLESKEPSKEGWSASSNLAVRERWGTGQFVKSKFYGQSHWMNAIDPVRSIRSYL
jgi:hypothetical protein